jgi:hypothetical protein
MLDLRFSRRNNPDDTILQDACSIISFIRVDDYKSFGVIYSLYLRKRSEDGDRIFLRNVGNH